MKILRTKRLFLPALTIIGVVIILLVIISISTYRNLNREQESALRFLHSQGVSILRALEAGARTGMMMPMWDEDTIGQLLRETAKDESVAYLYLSTKDRKIGHGFGPHMNVVNFVQTPIPNDRDSVISRNLELKDGTSVYEVIKVFEPLSTSPEKLHHHMASRSHTHEGDIIVLGLVMRNFDEIRKLDYHHAMVMAGILVITGSGALFFILVIQNYYVVNRSLKQTQDYSRIVFTNMPLGLLSVDLTGKVVAYNPKAADILALDESTILKRGIDQIFDLKTCKLNLNNIGCNDFIEKEILHKSRNNKLIPLSVSSTPIIDQHQARLGALIIMRDLSDIKRLEEKVLRSEKLAAIGQLAAGLAHEIRNPLSSIRGFAQFLRHTLKNNPREQEYAQTMVTEIDRINRVVTDLLSMARPKKLALQQTNIGELVRRTTDLVKSEVKSRNLHCAVIIQPDIPLVSVDPSSLTQALLNLLLNALQTNDPGSQISVGAELLKKNELAIWVEDDGAGIPLDMQKKVFEPFFTTREAGTGLGLAIVHSIAEAHDGSVVLESPPPRHKNGCRFTIVIPIKTISENESASLEEAHGEVRN